MSDNDRVEIIVSNSENEGFAQRHLVTRTATVGDFVKTVVTREPSNYTITLNGIPASDRDTFDEGDRLAITPKKIAGA